MSLEMAPQDGPAGRDSHVGPRSHSGANRDQYGVTVQVRFSTVLGKDRTYLYGTVGQYGRNVSNTPCVHKPECNTRMGSLGHFWCFSQKTESDHAERRYIRFVILKVCTNSKRRTLAEKRKAWALMYSGTEEVYFA